MIMIDDRFIKLFVDDYHEDGQISIDCISEKSLRLTTLFMIPSVMLLRSPISMVKHCCTCQGNYNSKLTHEQLEASGPILYKVSRNIRVTQTLSVERQLGAGHPEAVSKP